MDSEIQKETLALEECTAPSRASGHAMQYERRNLKLAFVTSDTGEVC
jgi:hypothetical protein